jgi:hypothetical protein
VNKSIRNFPYFSFSYCPKYGRKFSGLKKEVIGAISFDKAFITFPDFLPINYKGNYKSVNRRNNYTILNLFLLQKMFSFTVRKMVMVTTGKDWGSKKTELIDLADPSKVCQQSGLEDYRFDKVYSASGGLLNNNVALICGGYRYAWSTPKQGKCFAINDGNVTVELAKPRSDAASVVLNGNTLWLTGGFLHNGRTQSTEFVNLTGTTPGPDLPLKVNKHCLVRLNETTVILIGGNLDQYIISKATYYYNVGSKGWISGPSLKMERKSHSCAVFKSAKHGHPDTVIVTGGVSAYGYSLASTEFLNVNNNSWTSGMKIELY